MPNMIEIIKQASLDAVENSNPMRIYYGLVTTTSPISIKIDQKFTIPNEFIVLTRNVTKYKTNAIYNIKAHETEYDTPEEPHHKHDVKKKIFTEEITIDNSLKVGDKVIMIQAQGGQQYIVLDKVE